jgi:hypothetical protein
VAAVSAPEFPTPESLSGKRLEEAVVDAEQWGPGVVADARIRDLELGRHRGWWRRRMLVRGVVFRRCVIGQLTLRRVTFEDCVFEDVRFDSVYGDFDLVRCTVWGLWSGPVGDSGRVEGLDVSRASGMAFCEGVDLDQITWADDGSQVVVTRQSPGWRDVELRAQGGDQVAWGITRRVSGRQRWALLSRASMSADDWDFYASRFGGRVGGGPGLLPGLGVGQVAVVLHGPEGSVREAAVWDLELSPSPVDLLAGLLGIDQAERSAVLDADSETGMSYGLGEALVRGLGRPLGAGLADRWAEALSASGYFLWAESAADLLAVLHREAGANLDATVTLEFTQ